MDHGEVSTVAGACHYWREQAVLEDLFNIDLKPADRKVQCWCFIEGLVWEQPRRDAPVDCPMRDSCRYYVRT